MPVDPSLLARLYDRAQAARWDVTHERFAQAVDTSVDKEFAGRTPSLQDVERYVRGLHLEDLALAVACADGHEAAWDHFIREHRPGLYRAADAIDPTGGARELADALYADLFGLKVQQGRRQSLFRYFHGRSRLTTWLRAVLSQRHVDGLRAGRRNDPLPEEGEAIARPAAVEANLDRSRWVTVMRAAMAAAVAALTPRDRLRLMCYYVQNLTLAEIGRMHREHEATVSRHLTRTRRTLRDAVEQRLRTEHGLDETAIAQCFESVLDNAGTIDLGEIMAVGKVGVGDRSK